MPLVGSDAASQMELGLGQGSVTSQLSGWGSAVVTEIKLGLVAFASGGFTGTAPTSGGALTSGAASGGRISGLSASRLASAIATQAGYPSVSSILTSQATAIVNHIMNNGRVAFSTVAANCTNTAISAGVATNASAVSGGTISAIDGPTLAQAIHTACGYSNTFVVASEAAMNALSPQTGDMAVRTDLNQIFIFRGSWSVLGPSTSTPLNPPVSPTLVGECTKLVNYIIAHANCVMPTFSAGTSGFSATAPAGGGPIVSGAGVACTIL